MSVTVACVPQLISYMCKLCFACDGGHILCVGFDVVHPGFSFATITDERILAQITTRLHNPTRENRGQSCNCSYFKANHPYARQPFILITFEISGNTHFGVDFFRILQNAFTCHELESTEKVWHSITGHRRHSDVRQLLAALVRFSCFLFNRISCKYRDEYSAH